jgi:hypothetical protein
MVMGGIYHIIIGFFDIPFFSFFLVRRARMMNEGGISLDSGHRDTTPKSDFRCSSNQLAQHKKSYLFRCISVYGRWAPFSVVVVEISLPKRRRKRE